MNRFQFLILLGMLRLTSYAQTNSSSDFRPKIDAINFYVEFFNESVHGMFMVNRLLVEQNMELNKYVDLESEKINNYSNKDLPLDIFEDKDHWFYEVSPYELYHRAKSNSGQLAADEKAKYDALADKILTIIKASNKLRFDVEKAGQNDLKLKANLDAVYKKLEEGVKLFDEMYAIGNQLEKQLDASKSKYHTPTSTYYKYYDDMLQFIKAQRLLLSKIREKEVEQFSQIYDITVQKYAAYKLLNIDAMTANKTPLAKIKYSFGNASKAADDFISFAKQFSQNELIPNKYKYYGRFYYFYNVELISKFNKYGSGVAFESNNMINLAAMPVIKFLEMPHLFQVVYPKKIVSTDVITSSDNAVTAIPTTVKDRKVSTNGKTIRVDADVIEIELYDHLIADGDVVSINFNGDWILEKETLEKGSKKIKLKLNPDGKNYLLLHADNVGKRPPNTMAIAYLFRGEKNEIIMKSDNNTSEYIEIINIKKK